METKEQYSSSLVKSGVRLSLAHWISAKLKDIPIKGAGWLRARLPYFIAPIPKGRILLLLKNRLKLIVDPFKDKGLESSLYYHGEYEDGIISIISLCLKDGKSLIDIGGNIGLISLAVSKTCNQSEVYCFEPEPDTFQILLDNIALNNNTRIHPYNIALGAEESNGIIYSKLNISRGSASLIGEPDDKNKGKKIEIQTLDNFISTNDVNSIGMIKIDVEGWENEVIQGAKDLLSGENAPALCVEHNSLQIMKDSDSKRLFSQILKINKYQGYKLPKGKHRLLKLIPVTNVEMLPVNDNVFYFLPAHIDKLSKTLFEN